MKSLSHQGILVLFPYKAVGYVIFIGEKAFQLNDKQEEMAFHWCKKLGTPYAEDPIFKENFFKDFCKELGVKYTEEINFEQLILAYQKEKYDKELLTKEEKKTAREERKKLREERKEKYGYAEVDGKQIEISNWIAELSCIFMGRGGHALRGTWKEGPKEEDITLNLSPNSEMPPGSWKGRVWESDKMYVAKWIDKLSGKVKYVWLADTWSKKQKREKAKFEKAEKLGKNLKKIEHLIGTGLYSSDLQRKKIASACYLIYHLNLRVGDEKQKGESDTVGALTLRPEHLKIEGNKVYLDFLGKDSVLWSKTLLANPQFILNLQTFLAESILSERKTLIEERIKLCNEEQCGLKNIKENMLGIGTENLERIIQKLIKENSRNKDNGDFEIKTKLGNIEENGKSNILTISNRDTIQTSKGLESKKENMQEETQKKVLSRELEQGVESLKKWGANANSVDKQISESWNSIIEMVLRIPEQTGRTGKNGANCKSCVQTVIESFISRSENSRRSIFEGLNSKEVARFLSEAIPGLTAKVFRTWKISKEVKDYLERTPLKKMDPLWLKKLIFKLANLEGAKTANHKRKIPNKWEESLEKKKEKAKRLRKEANKLRKEGKLPKKKIEQAVKAEMDLELFSLSKEYTLGTSLRSYISPTILKEWCDKVDLPYEKIYSKALLKKFSWCLE